VRTDRQGIPGLGGVFDWLDVASGEVVVLKIEDVPCRDQKQAPTGELLLVEIEEAVVIDVDLQPGCEGVDRR
jgi:hypothetical protein